jgi:CheY-like chemotaxis protein
MAQILISEPDDAVRWLLERMVSRLGHEPVMVRVPSPDHLERADALLVEPTATLGVVLAQAASIAKPSLPIICSSGRGPAPELAMLGVVFAACLVKPFTLQQLKEAIDKALLTPTAHRNAGAL